MRPEIHRNPDLKNGFRFRPQAAAHRSEAGTTVLEIAISLGLLALTGLASTQSLLTANRMAAASRVMTAARAIVQRNIDAAISVRFDSASTPSILQTTGDAGVTFEDDGNGDSLVDILTQKNETGSMQTLVRGTLKRTVTAVSNDQSADIRKVVFQLNYTFQGRPYAVEMSTQRSIDD